MECKDSVWKSSLKKNIDIFVEFKLDILAVKEILWTGMEWWIIRFEMSVIAVIRHISLVLILLLVWESVSMRIIEFKPVNEKICKQSINGKTQNISVVSAYDPIEENWWSYRWILWLPR